MKDYSLKAKIDFLIQCGIEVWLPIKDFENYSVSSYGRVKNNITDKILKPGTCHGDYLIVTLCKDGKAYSKTIHRLVAEAFIDKVPGKEQLDHKSKDKTDNSVYNLHWVTNEENCRNKSNNRAVEQYDLDGNFIQRFNSIAEACDYLEVSRPAGNSNIYACCKNINKKAYGFIWKYAEENKNED